MRTAEPQMDVNRILDSTPRKKTIVNYVCNDRRKPCPRKRCRNPQIMIY